MNEEVLVPVLVGVSRGMSLIIDCESDGVTNCPRPDQVESLGRDSLGGAVFERRTPYVSLSKLSDDSSASLMADIRGATAERTERIDEMLATKVRCRPPNEPSTDKGEDTTYEKKAGNCASIGEKRRSKKVTKSFHRRWRLAGSMTHQPDFVVG
jgi:hypothetical protein